MGLCPRLPSRSVASGSVSPWPLACQDRSENEADRVRCALVLCYGHVASQAPRELLLAKVESDILRNMFQAFSTKVGTAGKRAVRARQ